MNTKAIEEKLDELFIDYSGNVPGASVGIINDGKLLCRCYGLSNLQKSMLITPKTNFEIASLTKAFTAACILKLVEEGRLNLTDNINDFIPDFPEYGRNITIKPLLQHTSGMPNIDYPVNLPMNEFMYQLKTASYNISVPGSKYVYCNAGYVLLGLIIEIITGQPLYEYMDKTIFKPLQMSDTLLYVNGINEVKNRAYGYSGKDGGYKLLDENDIRLMRGAAGIYSSVLDMAKWDQALYSDKLLSYDLLREAFTQGQLNDGSYSEYGFGWIIGNISGFKSLSHSGGNPGFKHFFIRLPEKRFSLILFSNRDSIDFLKSKSAEDISNELREFVRFLLNFM
ncbi:beta-lactamase family protein [Candidatus Bathyarchaeota archaeon]|nr:beta-lactamase family protein [Candidatus Bathyarchaeota archaeon]